jgi:hypothetical protein
VRAEWVVRCRPEPGGRRGLDEGRGEWRGNDGGPESQRTIEALLLEVL